MKNIVLLGNNGCSNSRELTVLPKSFKILVCPDDNGLVSIDFMEEESCLYSTLILLDKEDFDFFLDDTYENFDEEDLSDYLIRLIAEDIGHFVNYEYRGDQDEDDLFGQSFMNLREFKEYWTSQLHQEIQRRMKTEKEEVDKI